MNRFVADSSCDLPEISGVSTVSVPLTIYSDVFSYRDEPGMDIHGMLDALEDHRGRSYTSCPSVDAWLQAFRGADAVYVGTLTSALSGAYNAAMAARDIHLQSHPETKIHVFDTLTTGPEGRLFMEKVIELASAGLEFDQVVARAEAYRQTTRLLFSLRSLRNMAQNGRVSKVLASAVGVLGIGITGTASPEGTLEPIAKTRGEKRTMARLIEEVEKAGYRGGRLRISHVENPAAGEMIREHFLAQYPDADIVVYPADGLCSYYAERGGVLIGVETES